MQTADPIDDTAAPIQETESPAASDEPNTDTPVTAEPTEDPYIDIPTYNPDMDPTVTATPDFDTPNGHSITPGGNAGLVDDLRDGERDFITVQTRSGEYFYIIIDHTQNGNNVYFLNMVDTQDLLALLDDDTKSKLGCICIDKCSAGHINENCPVCSLKQMARSVSYLSDRKLLSYADLEKAMREANERYNALSEQIKAAEKRLAENAVLQKHITDYSKTRKTYIAYRESGYSKKFLAEHEAEITLHRAAKQAFDELKMTRIPTIKSLREEYARLLAEKKKAYSEFVEAKSEKRALTVAKANVDAILGNEKEKLSRSVSEEHK